MTPNASINRWNMNYEKEYLQTMIGHFAGVGAKDDVERTLSLFADPQAFLRAYLVALKRRRLSFVGNEELQEYERMELRDYAQKLIEPLKLGASNASG